MKFNIVQVNYATGRARDAKDLVLDRAIRVLNDPDRAKRMEQCECLACFYLTGSCFAGQAFTSWACQACEVEQPMHPNTAVPKLCLECADRYSLCTQCLADLDLRMRQKVTRNNKFRSRRPSRRG